MIIQVGGGFYLKKEAGKWKLENINKTGSSDFINSMFKLAHINPNSFSQKNKTPEQLFNSWFQSSGLNNELKNRSGLSRNPSNRSDIVLGKGTDGGSRGKIPRLLDKLLNNVNGRNINEKLKNLNKDIFNISSSGGGSRKGYINDQLQGRGTGNVRVSRDKVLNYLNNNTLSIRTRESSRVAHVDSAHSQALTNSQDSVSKSQKRLRPPTPPPDPKSMKEFPSLGTFDYKSFGTATLKKKPAKGSKKKKRRQTKKGKKKSKKKTRKK